MVIKVVILGAGYAGAQCANTLQSLLEGSAKKSLREEVRLTVVEKRTHSLHKIAALRAAAVGESFIPRILIPNNLLLIPGKDELIHTKIKSVTGTNVVLEDPDDNSQEIILDYDILVCATGSTNKSIAEPDGIANETKEVFTGFFKEYHMEIRAAKKVLVVGGGPVGVELAAEIASEYPEGGAFGKKVSLIHSAEILCNRLYPSPSQKFFASMEKQLQALGVEILIEQTFVIPEDKLEQVEQKGYLSGEYEYTTEQGEAIVADLVLFCTGKKVNSEMYPSAWKDTTTEELYVSPTLQLVSNDKVFAIGDLNDVRENKQGMLAANQGAFVANNILRMLTGKPLKRYSPSNGSVKVAIGRKGGISNETLAVIDPQYTVQFKSKNLLVQKAWTIFRHGYDIPAERKNKTEEQRKQDAKTYRIGMQKSRPQRGTKASSFGFGILTPSKFGKDLENYDEEGDENLENLSPIKRVASPLVNYQKQSPQVTELILTPTALARNTPPIEMEGNKKESFVQVPLDEQISFRGLAKTSTNDSDNNPPPVPPERNDFAALMGPMGLRKSNARFVQEKNNHTIDRTTFLSTVSPTGAPPLPPKLPKRINANESKSNNDQSFNEIDNGDDDPW